MHNLHHIHGTDNHFSKQILFYWPKIQHKKDSNCQFKFKSSTMTTNGITVLELAHFFSKMVPLCHEQYLIIVFYLNFHNIALMT